MRIVAEVEYSAGTSERIWYDFDRSLEDAIDRSGTPWLAALLPLAVTLGESLSLGLPVDAALLANARTIMAIWSSWYSELRPIDVHAETIGPVAPARRCATFFSGGVDSFFTVLRRQRKAAGGASADPCQLTPVDDLLCVRGFDIPLAKAADFARMKSSMAAAAQAMGCNLIDVATNLRDTRFGRADWCKLSHGCALASVGHLFSQRFSEAVIASSYGFRDLRFWGSHPLTDPLLSSSTMRIVHDGAEFTRIDKTRFIAASDIAQRHLRVCSIRESDGNCSNCNKCLRTMTTLYLLGALNSFHTFDAAAFDVDKLNRVYSATPAARTFFEEICELARGCGRTDVVAAIQQSFRFSGRRNRVMAFNRRLFRTMYRMPMLWRYSEPFFRWANKRALAGAIC
jgi:hypothetical protein